LVETLAVLLISYSLSVAVGRAIEELETRTSLPEKNLRRKKKNEMLKKAAPRISCPPFPGES
jgi:hypothetical protein